MVQQAYEKMLKSLVIRKMQIKTTVTTAHALEWLKFKKKKPTVPKKDEAVQLVVGGNVKSHLHFEKQ